jgi:hypothetical protein
MSNHPIRDDRNLATLEKAISHIATLEAERDVARAEIERLTAWRDQWKHEAMHGGHVDQLRADIERLRSALAGVMPMVEKYVDCNHDFNECANVRNRDAARAVLKVTP